MMTRNFLEICVLYLIFNLAFSEKICVTQNTCECVLPNNTIIDLSSVGSPEHPRFYDVLFHPNCPELYSYNPCFAFDSPDKYTVTDTGNTRCVGASACVKGFGGTDGKPPEEHAIGLQKDAVFGKDGEQMYINYTASGLRGLQVRLKCVNESSAAAVLTMETECSISTGPIVLTLSSKCACPNGCPRVSPPEQSSSSGLSTGSKLLIIFFTLGFAYFIIGIVWNYCNGSQGMELIPNIEFWNGLPTLIMEGVVFTCSCCGRQRSYGEV